MCSVNKKFWKMSTEKSIRVVEFEGESREWRSWKVKFLALAARHNYRDIIDGSTALPDSSTEAANLSADQGSDPEEILRNNDELEARPT